MNVLKKQLIVNTAIDLFAEHGIAKVSLVRIAKHLGASTGMIYYYFKNGKDGIVSEILNSYENYISSCVPNRTAWISPDANAKEVLFKLFFNFPKEEALRLRKIVRIIMSEMYYNGQIAEYAKIFFINGRELLLADCFQALVETSKIDPLDAESAARFFNRLLLAYAIEDALLYPYIGNEEIAEKQNINAVRDCTNFMNYILSARK